MEIKELIDLLMDKQKGQSVEMKVLLGTAAGTIENLLGQVDALKAELRDERHRHDRYVDFELAEAEELRKLKGQLRWIPVTERLPEIPDGWAEHPDPVLYMTKSTKTIYAGYYGENGTYRDKYFRKYADQYEGVDAFDALCWMWQKDLPEPPKGE